MTFNLVQWILAHAILRNSDNKWVYEKYIVFKEVSSRNRFAWYNTPTFFANLFSTVLNWSYQDKFLSNITPKNFMDDVPSIILFPIFNAGIFKGILSMIEFLWNNVWIVFSTFKDTVFALSHWLILQFTINCFKNNFYLMVAIKKACVVCEHYRV